MDEDCVVRRVFNCTLGVDDDLIAILLLGLRRRDHNPDGDDDEAQGNLLVD